MTVSTIADLIRDDIRALYPCTSRYPEISEGIVQAEAYVQWRRTRVYHHASVEFGARTPDGKAGYTLIFWDGPDETSGSIRVTVTGEELAELGFKIEGAINGGV